MYQNGYVLAQQPTCLAFHEALTSDPAHAQSYLICIHATQGQSLSCAGLEEHKLFINPHNLSFSGDGNKQTSQSSFHLGQKSPVWVLKGHFSLESRTFHFCNHKNIIKFSLDKVMLHHKGSVALS